MVSHPIIPKEMIDRIWPIVIQNRKTGNGPKFISTWIREACESKLNVWTPASLAEACEELVKEKYWPLLDEVNTLGVSLSKLAKLLRERAEKKEVRK